MDYKLLLYIVGLLCLSILIVYSPDIWWWIKRRRQFVFMGPKTGRIQLSKAIARGQKRIHLETPAWRRTPYRKIRLITKKDDTVEILIDVYDSENWRWQTHIRHIKKEELLTRLAQRTSKKAHRIIFDMFFTIDEGGFAVIKKKSD